jgi:ABC-type sugar transport system permease subunit
MAANTSEEISSPATGAREIPRAPRERRLFPYLALIPAALFVVVLMVLPIGATIYHSFTNWDGLTSTFIGMRNFTLILHNPIVSEIFLNSLIFLISVPLILFASLVVAVLVYEKVLGWRLFRFLFFIPCVLSPVIIGVLFSTFFLPGGMADQPLRAVGLGSFAWLSYPWTARLVVILALVWSSFGFGMVVILSAMDLLTMYQRIFFGSFFVCFVWYVFFFLFSQRLWFCFFFNDTATTEIYTFTSLFSFVFVITAGGPGFATTTVDYYTYLTTFENGQFGYGAALAVMLFLIVLVLTIAQIKLFPQREVQQGS